MALEEEAAVASEAAVVEIGAAARYAAEGEAQEEVEEEAETQSCEIGR